MSQIHLKVYDFTESPDQIERKKEFKDFIKIYKDIIANKKTQGKNEAREGRGRLLRAT
jgi:hypothetical protein